MQKNWESEPSSRTGYILSAVFLIGCFWLSFSGPISSEQSAQIRSEKNFVSTRRGKEGTSQAGNESKTAGEIVLDAMPQIQRSGLPPDTRDSGTEFWPFFGLRLKITDTLIVIFTGALAVFTYQLRRSTDKLWSAGETQLAVAADAAAAARKSAEVADQSLKELSRAFVYVKEIKIVQSTTEADGLEVSVFWENNGTTQTKNLRSYISSATFTPKLPDGFEYKDVGTDNPGMGSMGPKGTMFTGAIQMPRAKLEALAAQRCQLLIWGWVEYDDIFQNTNRHRTEFCVDLKIRSLDGRSFCAVPIVHSEYNGSNEECGPRFLRAQKRRPRVAWADITLEDDTLTATGTVT